MRSIEIISILESPFQFKCSNWCSGIQHKSKRMACTFVKEGLFWLIVKLALLRWEIRRWGYPFGSAWGIASKSYGHNHKHLGGLSSRLSNNKFSSYACFLCRAELPRGRREQLTRFNRFMQSTNQGFKTIRKFSIELVQSPFTSGSSLDFMPIIRWSGLHFIAGWQ